MGTWQVRAAPSYQVSPGSEGANQQQLGQCVCSRSHAHLPLARAGRPLPPTAARGLQGGQTLGELGPCYTITATATAHVKEPQPLFCAQTRVLAVHFQAVAPASRQDTAPVLSHNCCKGASAHHCGVWHRRATHSQGFTSGQFLCHRHRRDITGMEETPASKGIKHQNNHSPPTGQSQGRAHLSEGARAPSRAGWAICPTGTNQGPTTSPWASKSRSSTSLVLPLVSGGKRAAHWQAAISGQSRYKGATTNIHHCDTLQSMETHRSLGTPQGAHSEGAKQTELHTRPAPGDPQASEPGCGRAGMHKLRPSWSHRGRMDGWWDPQATSALHSQHQKHHISDDLTP